MKSFKAFETGISIISVKPDIQLVVGHSGNTVLVGDPVTIRANITGIPTPTVTWTCNGQDVRKDKDIKIEETGEQHKMTIPKATVRQTGTYTIKAINNVGQEDKIITLIVLGKKYFFSSNKISVSGRQVIMNKNSLDDINTKWLTYQAS